MNRITTLAYPLISVLALAAAGIAHAESPTVDSTAATAFVSQKTRAEVVAEYHQAKKDGLQRVWSTQYNPLAEMKSLKTREDVRAEVLAAQANGTLSYGEDSGAFAMSQARPAKQAPQLLATAPSALR